MSEDRAPYTGENDPPAPTMFERLKAALVAELQRQYDESRGTGLGWFDHPDMGGDVATIEGEVDLSPIIRALLTEMRRATDGPMTEAAKELARRGGDTIIIFSEWPDVDRFWRAMIDAILAEAGQNAKSHG